jgi:hypothetical protein
MTNPTGDLQGRAPSTEQVTPSIPAATSAARERLATALVTACRPRQGREQDRVAAELRGAVTAYISALRGDGALVEQAVISTKELVASTIGGPNVSPERRKLAEQVVSWGIDAYYDAPPRAD